MTGQIILAVFLICASLAFAIGWWLIMSELEQIRHSVESIEKDLARSM